MTQMNVSQDKVANKQKWYKSHPIMLIISLILFAVIAVYYVAYVKLKPIREFSGLQEHPVPLGTSTGNY